MKTEVDNFTPFDLIFDHNTNIIAEQRIIIYSTSLEIYKQRKAKGCLAGICTCIKRTLDRLELYKKNIYLTNFSYYFPEFKKLKEEFEVNVNEEGYWWDMDFDRTPFFEAMIEEAEEEIEKLNTK